MKATSVAGAVLALVVAHGAAAADLLDGSFESGAYYPFNTPATNRRGTTAIVTAPVFSGRHAFRSTIETAAGETGAPSRIAETSRVFVPLESAPSHLFAKFSFLVDGTFVNATEGNYSIFAGLGTPTSGGVWRVGLMRSGGQLFLNLYGPTAADRARGTVPVTTNTWYCVELEVDRAGEVRVYLDGALEIELTGLGELAALNQLRLGWSTWTTNQGGSVFFDRAIVSTERHPYQPVDMNVIHAPSFFGRIGMRFLVFLAGLSGTERFRATLTGERGLDQTVFSRDGNLERNFDFSLDLRTLPADTYTFTIELLDGQGAVLASETDTFTKPYDGVPVTGIDENSAVCLNGEPFFFVNAFGLRRVDVPLWTARKFSNAQAGYFDETQSPASWADYLDKAALAGTVAIGPVRDQTWVNEAASGVQYPTLDEITTAVNASRDHPALLFWNWMDEPITNNTNITGSTLGNVALVRSWTERTHEQDPGHLVFGTEWATLAAFEHAQYEMFHPNWVCDVYSFDIYPIEFEEDTGDKVSEAAELNERFHRYNYGLLPFSAWVETADVRTPGHAHATTLYPPTPEQLRMVSWIPIVHGAKGISWFHYFGPTPPENFSVMSELVRFTERYTRVILGPEPKTIAVSDDADVFGRRVDTMVRESDTDIYVFAVRVSEFAGERYVNPAERGDIQVEFTLQGGPSSAGVEDLLASFKPARHQEWDTFAVQSSFTLTLNTPVEPGSVVLGGGSGSEESDVGSPTAWSYLFDDGDGNLRGRYAWEPQIGTIDYATGVMIVDFGDPVDAGENKIRAGFVARDPHPRSLTLSNGRFRDVFRRGELHVYRIPKSGGGGPEAGTGVSAGCGCGIRAQGPGLEVLLAAVLLALRVRRSPFTPRRAPAAGRQGPGPRSP